MDYTIIREIKNSFPGIYMTQLIEYQCTLSRAHNYGKYDNKGKGWYLEIIKVISWYELLNAIMVCVTPIVWDVITAQLLENASLRRHNAGKTFILLCENVPRQVKILLISATRFTSMCDTFTGISMNDFYQCYGPDIWGASIGVRFGVDSSSGCCGQYWYSSGRCAPRVQVKFWHFTTHGNWPLSTTLVLCKEKPPVTPHTKGQ